MKKITLLFLTILSTVFYGQDKLTSSLSEFKVDGVFQNSDRATYTYDENNNLTEEKDFFWNSEDESWILNSTTTYSYNNNNKVVSTIYTEYENNEVVEQDRTLNTYNAAGDIVEQLDQELENGIWVNEFKNDFIYLNNRIQSGKSYEWEGGEWIPSEDGFLTELFYNDNGSLVRFQESANENILSEDDDRGLYTYDVSSNLILEDFQSWNGTDWVSMFRVEKTYDANGNVIKTEERYTDEDGTSEFSDSNNFDTTQLLSDFAHPFKDKTGIDNLLNPLGYVNKILSSSTNFESEEEFRTTYFYGNEASLSTETNSVLTLKLYPNPTTDLVTVAGNNFFIKNIEVFNVLGKKIKTVTTNTISLKEFVAGVYVLKIRTVDGKIAIKRIVKN